MKPCQHRWIEMHWGKQYRSPNTYMYCCMRCYQSRIARLLELTNAA